MPSNDQNSILSPKSSTKLRSTVFSTYRENKSFEKKHRLVIVSPNIMKEMEDEGSNVGLANICSKRRRRRKLAQKHLEKFTSEKRPKVDAAEKFQPILSSRRNSP